jgi:hypothetical protein
MGNTGEGAAASRPVIAAFQDLPEDTRYSNGRDLQEELEVLVEAVIHLLVLTPDRWTSFREDITTAARRCRGKYASTTPVFAVSCRSPEPAQFPGSRCFRPDLSSG